MIYLVVGLLALLAGEAQATSTVTVEAVLDWS